MPERIYCPRCQAMLEIADQFAGQVVRCSMCQQTILAPVPAPPPRPSLPPAPSPVSRAMHARLRREVGARGAGEALFAIARLFVMLMLALIAVAMLVFRSSEPGVESYALLFGLGAVAIAAYLLADWVLSEIENGSWRVLATFGMICAACMLWGLIYFVLRAV